MKDIQSISPRAIGAIVERGIDRPENILGTFKKKGKYGGETEPLASREEGRTGTMNLWSKFNQNEK